MRSLLTVNRGRMPAENRREKINDCCGQEKDGLPNRMRERLLRRGIHRLVTRRRSSLHHSRRPVNRRDFLPHWALEERNRSRHSAHCAEQNRNRRPGQSVGENRNRHLAHCVEENRIRHSAHCVEESTSHRLAYRAEKSSRLPVESQQVAAC